MRNRNLICVAALVCLAISAPAVLASDRQPHPRPFWGNLTGQATFPQSGACLAITGAPWQTLSVTEGRVTHLGRTSLSTSHCSTLDGSAAVNGVATFTAANGDEVWAIYTATTVVWPSPPDMLLVQESDFTVVGGTGRFDGASGHLQGTVYVTYEGINDPSWPLRFVLSGTLVY
jgi:hypothetical protein